VALILVTGASTGLGLDTALALAAAGHEVVVHVRDATRRVAREHPWRGVVYGDLTDPDQTRDVARQAEDHGRFDVVIHNAGALRSAEALAVNAIAPYVLTARMAKPRRLIYLSSSMHRSGSVDLRRIERGGVTYSDSKLYVTALSAAVAARWEGTVSQSVDPGWVPTRMGGAGAPDDLTAGHQTQVWLATADDIVPATGGYWHHRRLERPHPAAQDPEFQGRLLRALEDRTGVPLD
jgi:NAD(P)-dependent dehydrogenase (short-subunit alcohol dehydrogenase family)